VLFPVEKLQCKAIGGNQGTGPQRDHQSRQGFYRQWPHEYKLGLLLQVSYVAAIDKTSVGKINKKLLREKNLR